VGADEREAILVVANLRERSLPSFDGVTAFAVGAELAAMDVGVAVCAAGADIFECEAHVAFGARQLGVHAAQRVTGLIMIELGIRTNRFPTGVGVTLLAGNRDGTVRIGDFGLWAADTRPRILSRLLQRRARKKRR